jgi:hypothetical protein
MRINNAFSQIIIGLEWVVSLKSRICQLFTISRLMSPEKKKLLDLVKSQEL